jgi:hypothetical protein
MRYSKLVVLGLVLIAACFAGVAAAHTKYFTSTIVARFTPERGNTGTYSGRVVSPKAKCKANREITVTDSRHHRLGQGTSDASGNFSFHGRTPPPTGSVEAEAEVKRIKPKTRRHKHLCLSGRAHVIVLR